MKKINLPKGTVVPNHISIIMDGNRRWARARGLAPVEGHKAGYAAMKEIMRSSRGLGVHTLSLWGFSTENWERPAHEVAGIMQLVYKALQELKSELVKEDIRFIHLGRKDRLPSFVLKQIKDLEDSTKDNKSFVLNLALDYGGKDEIVRAVKKIIDSGVPSTEIDEKLIDSYLDTKDQPYPYPDLFIRTSGEQRTSGFLPWQSIYSEFLWIDKHLPDISVLTAGEEEDLVWMTKNRTLHLCQALQLNLRLIGGDFQKFQKESLQAMLPVTSKSSGECLRIWQKELQFLCVRQ